MARKIRPMPDLLELPHTPGCIVCGPDNPLGLKMSLSVDPATGIVHVNFAPEDRHIGFQGIVHGGVIGTIIDEAMVWAATWNGKRFCVCGEFTVRFRRAAQIGEPLHLEARVEFARPKFVQTMATLRTPAGSVVATGEGKYVPMALEESQKVMRTFVEDERTKAASGVLRGEA